MIRFDCPHCGKTLRAPEDASGKKAKCSGCGRGVVVPPAAPTSARSTPRAAPPVEEEPEDEFVPEPAIDEEFEIVDEPPQSAPLPPRIPSPSPLAAAGGRSSFNEVRAQQEQKGYPALRLYIWIIRSFARIVFFVYVGIVGLVVIVGTILAFVTHGGLPLALELWFTGIIAVGSGFLLMVTLVAMVEWMEATADTAHYAKQLLAIAETRTAAKAE